MRSKTKRKKGFPRESCFFFRHWQPSVSIIVFVIITQSAILLVAGSIGME